MKRYYGQGINTSDQFTLVTFIIHSVGSFYTRLISMNTEFKKNTPSLLFSTNSFFFFFFNIS